MLNSPRSQPFFIREMLQVPSYLCGPPLDPLQQLPVFLVLGAPDLDAVLQMGPHKGRVERDNHLLALLATPLLMELRIPLAFQAASTHCLVVFSFSTNQTDLDPESLSPSQEDYSQGVLPVFTQIWDYLNPSVKPCSLLS